MKSRYFEIAENKHVIKCKLYSSGSNSVKDVVIYGHGFAGHKDNKAAERFAEKAIAKTKDVAVIVFDFPAHGSDVKKNVRLDDCREYIRLVTDYANDAFDRPGLFSYATSFGGYLVLDYLSLFGNPFGKIALRSPAVNIYEIMMNTVLSQEDMGKIEKGKSVLCGFDRKVRVDREFLEELRINDIRKKDYTSFADDIILFHGKKDEVVPLDQVQDFSENNIIELEVFEKADHRFQDVSAMGTVNKTVMEWFGI